MTIHTAHRNVLCNVFVFYQQTKKVEKKRHEIFLRHQFCGLSYVYDAGYRTHGPNITLVDWYK